MIESKPCLGIWFNSAYIPCRSKAVFKSLGEEDIGIYSCLVTHTDGASSSYTLSEEGGF